MKKLARAAALPVLAALLSACATPPGGSNLGASDSLTPGQKKEVGEMLEAWSARLPQNRKEVKEVVIQKKARNLLKELEERPKGTPDQIDGVAFKKGLDELVALNALDQGDMDEALKDLPPPGSWGPVEKREVRKELKPKLAVVAGLDDFKPLVELMLSEEGSSFIRREIFKFELGNIVPKSNINKVKMRLASIVDIAEKKKGIEFVVHKPSDKDGPEIEYVFENLAGLTETDKEAIKAAKKDIETIPTFELVSIRQDRLPSKLEIPVNRVSIYEAVAGDIGSKIIPEGVCQYRVTVELNGLDKETNEYLFRAGDGSKPEGYKEIPSGGYSYIERGDMDKEGKCNVTFESDFHYAMVTPIGRKTVAQYFSIRLINGEIISVPESRFTEGKPACPPLSYPWNEAPGVRAKFEEILDDCE